MNDGVLENGAYGPGNPPPTLVPPHLQYVLRAVCLAGLGP